MSKPVAVVPAKEGSAMTTRMSVSFPSDIYSTLELLAREKKVSVAWIVRDAAEKYLQDRWPLLDHPT